MDKNVIGTIIALVSIIGASFGAKEYFVSRAEAASMHEKQLVSSERSNIETELKLIELELELLEGEYETITTSGKSEKKRLNRIEYLHHRQKILETRLLQLRDKE